MLVPRKVTYLQLRYQIHTSVKFSMFLVWQNFVGKKTKSFFGEKRKHLYLSWSFGGIRVSSMVIFWNYFG